MSQPNSEHKFHSIYGKFLKVAFEAVLDADTREEEIMAPGVSLTRDQLSELTHRNLSYLNVYHQAMVEGDIREGSTTTKIIAVPWADVSPDQSYLIFRTKPLGSNFPIFARFEDKPCFQGNKVGYDRFTHLDYFGLTKADGFNPVFAKIKDREQVIYLKVASEELGELQVIRVTPDQVPPKLLST